MTNLMSKSSLYDMLSMIIPGFITLFLLAQIVGCDTMKIFCCNCLAVPTYVCIFVLSYVAGLLVHYLSRAIFDRFLRNNPEHIEAAKRQFAATIKRLDKAKGKESKTSTYHLTFHPPFLQLSPSCAAPTALTLRFSLPKVTFRSRRFSHTVAYPR